MGARFFSVPSWLSWSSPKSYMPTLEKTDMLLSGAPSWSFEDGPLCLGTPRVTTQLTASPEHHSTVTPNARKSPGLVWASFPTLQGARDRTGPVGTWNLLLSIQLNVEVLW